MNKILVLILTVFTIVQNVHSARILCIIGNPSYSHQVFFQPLWRELAIRGHDVVVITSDPTNEKLPNFKEINTHETYASFKKAMDMLINGTFVDLMFKTDWAERVLEMMNQTVGLPQVQELIHDKSQHFDLLIVEHMLSPFFAFKKKYNCPVIGVVSFDAMANSHRIMGNAVHSVLYPTQLLPKPDNLSFLERIMAIGLGNVFELIVYYKPLIKAMDTVARDSFNQTAEDVMESFESTDMLFVNTNPVFIPVRPHTPSTISVAGLHMKPPMPLPKDLKDYLDSAKEGVIYFSLGTNVKSNELSEELRKVFIETLSQVPFKVLYKYEGDTLPGKPDNVKLIKWAPQQDILRHKNIKCFITQGGIQSLEEAFYSHVPMIVIPFFGDQLPNAEKLKQKGLGLVLDRYNLNVANFKTAINEVITNPSYRNALKHYAGIVQDEPMKPLERAVWWIEYVLRHKGAQHLKGPTIPFYQYYYLDVLAALALVIVVLLGFILLMIKCVIKGIRKMCGCNNNVIKTKEE